MSQRAQAVVSTPSKVAPPRADTTPYTAAKDHVRRLETARSMQRGRSFMEEKEDATKGFGGKNISYFAGIALLINNITGPGVPQLPNMFAEAGWLVPTILILVIWIMTSLSTVMYCEAMRKIPGNEHFRGARVRSTPAPHHPRASALTACRCRSCLAATAPTSVPPP